MNMQTSIDRLIAAMTDVAAPTDANAAPLPDPAAYGRDLWERSVLFADTLRERADNMIEHDRAGMPPLLDFKYETLLDARQFVRPANYALLRITEVDGNCWDDCVDHAKPPVIIVDPRAGHGPGIGGFKRDSEVGMAMAEGHPVYFVIFFPEPVKDQTLEDVLLALRRFVEEVSDRHQGAAPVLYGNCQAGWAVTLLAAHCEGLAGPVVLNGSPLSYWAGEEGVNPMRVTGGLLGGSWLAHLISDLGDGRFDGAWLAQNFESLKPEKAIWEKYANLLTNVDTERDRFLDFERWWNGFYTLSRPEILSITQNLFIGNQLENGEMAIGDHCVADLRKITNPMIVFASYGDNITPPAQALGWIPAVYKDTADLKAAGQRIVYLTNAHVGHLGIFVSASVARLEHRAILESLDKIKKLKPGLYEMKIDNPTGDPDCHAPHYKVRFEARDVSDLAQEVPEQAFNTVQRVSEANEAFYSAFVSPWMRLMTTPASADMLKAMHPMRTSRLIFSEKFNPWMQFVRQTAETIAETRKPLGPDDPMIQREKAAIDAVGDAIERARIARDANFERTFRTLYGDDDLPGAETGANVPVQGSKETEDAVGH
jgi:poly(3-hydroxyalkanoate) synthetase